MTNKTISLPQELVEKAVSVANRTGATFSGLTRIALEKHLQNGRDNTRDKEDS